MGKFKKLKKIKIKEQLAGYGYFTDQIPGCFSSRDFYLKYDKLLPFADNKLNSECCFFTIAKNNIARRQIKIPNPEQQIKLIEFVINNEKKIKKFIEKSDYTQSNPFQSKSFTYGKVEFLDIPKLRDKFQIPSEFLHNIIQKVRISMGYKYKYKLDLSNYYDTIYTHAIEWATKGREQAKKDLASGKGKDDLGRQLDIFVRKTNSNETSGIPTGPYTSRIISEILLVRIDLELSAQKYKFTRYVDDYEFFFKSEDDIIRAQENIRQIFGNYRLRINEQKTQIVKYPYHTNVDMKRAFNYYLRKLGNSTSEQESQEIILNLFLKANELFEQGQKGTYKYLFKMIVNEDFTLVWKQVESFLINTILILPSLTQFAAEIILRNLDKLTTEFNLELLSNLNNSCVNHYHSEAQWLFWLLMKIEYKFSVAELKYLFENTDDTLFKIMLIYYIDKFKHSSKILEKLINDYYDYLTNFSIYSEYWLVIYECYSNKWFDWGKLKATVDRSNFFKKLNKEKVHFFKCE